MNKITKNMKRFFTRRNLAVIAVLALKATMVNAQNAANPWHLVAFEGDREVAFYNTEMITGIEATAQTVTVTLDNGKTFSHPTATGTFAFDPRRNGSGTASESIIAPTWSVHYAGGRLHFSCPVSNVAVYTVYGALAASFAGNHTNVPVALNEGLYIVHAGGQSAKLPVRKGGDGGATVQPSAEIPVIYPSTSPPVTLRSAGIKIYWNITATGTTTAVEIADVEKFRFTAGNAIVFTLKNGNTIELADYKGVEFAVEPAKATTTSGWDLERTLLYGGCTYALQSLGRTPAIVFAAIHKDGIAFQSMLLDGTNPRYQWFPNSSINSAMWDAARANSGSKLSLFMILGDYGVTYLKEYHNGKSFDMITTTGKFTGSSVESWPFNGNSNIISTNVKLNADGSITMSCTDINGKEQKYTFANR